jgi:glutamine synthetase
MNTKNTALDATAIKALVEKDGIQIVRLFFTDILGRLKGLNINAQELDRALSEGIAFDGSSIEGFVRIEESDLLAMPDIGTFRVFPFSPGGVSSVMFMCDVLRSDGQPLPSDPRGVLRRQIARAADMGFDSFYVGPELEYFYFPDSHNAQPLDDVGYFDILPLDRCADAREATLVALQELGMRMEASHHEVAPGQHEIDYRYGEGLLLADQIQISKVVIKEIARQYGIYASFMPKPVVGVCGSGMHVHQSLFNQGRNAFFDGADQYSLSAVGQSYVAGLLKHAQEITAVTNQWVNSYKRLVPGYEAPAYVCWGRKNRSTLVRVPAFKAGKSESCRVEYRAADSAANPYLAFAAMLGAGLAGIEGDYELAPPMEQNLFSMSPAEKAAAEIGSLPGDLFGATRDASKSAMLLDVLGSDLFDKFLANKYEEWEQYRVQVTDYELKTYLPVL